MQPRYVAALILVGGFVLTVAVLLLTGVLDTGSVGYRRATPEQIAARERTLERVAEIERLRTENDARERAVRAEEIAVAERGIRNSRLPAGAPQSSLEARVAPDSSFRSEVRRLLMVQPLVSMATRAVAYHNDVEIWVNETLTEMLAAQTCDQQRDFAADIWLRWSGMGVGAGAGVTVKSSTGRVLASAEEGFTGPRFHC